MTPPFWPWPARARGHRAPGGKQLASLVEVSEYEPDRVLAPQMLEGALPIRARITFGLTELGIRVQIHACGQSSGPICLAQPRLRLTLKRGSPATAPR